MAKTKTPELSEAEIGHAYLERTHSELVDVTTKKTRIVTLIVNAMEQYHGLCGDEDNIRLRLDQQLDEYYPVMEPLDGIGTE